METIYLICAAVGGTFIVCQFAMTLFGLGGGHDMAGDHSGHDFGGHDVGHDAGGGHDAAGDHHEVGHGNESTWFMGLLTIRTVTAGIAFFGIVGYIMEQRLGLEPIPALLVALGAGVAAVLLVGYVMKGIGRMNMDGTIRINKALGCNGTVYIPIPTGGGAGKVQVSVHNRTVEYRATAKEALPTGAKIVVVAIVGADTVEVAPAQ
jgi:membrane protein implicated in regulation of membrane protease activity